MIIKLWDNEKSDYPLLKIREGTFNKFKEILKEYQKEEDYNNLDFYAILEKEDILLELISEDEEVFF